MQAETRGIEWLRLLFILIILFELLHTSKFLRNIANLLVIYDDENILMMIYDDWSIRTLGSNTPFYVCSMHTIVVDLIACDVKFDDAVVFKIMQ